MGVAQRWLKPRPQNFSELFNMVIGSLFENLNVLPLKNFYLWSEIWQKISSKKGAFGTIDIFNEKALKLFKIKEKILF